MKLSDIVFYKNTLDSFDLAEYSKTSLMPTHDLISTASNTPFLVDDKIKMLMSTGGLIKQQVEQFCNSFIDLKEAIQNIVEQEEKVYFKNSSSLYFNEMVHDTPEYILKRRRNILPESEKYIRGRVKLYTSWKYPGMIIRPGLERYVLDMVALDPLYIVDTDVQLLEPVQRRFGEQYKRRLRNYIIREYSNDPLFEKFPKNQFGFCFAYNFFAYRPIEVIKQYLNELYECLRPGGVIGLDFNDCDYHGGVRLSENYYQCYTPGRIVKGHARDLGFTVENEHRTADGVSWLELRKPGELTSLRGGQTLAKIIEKSKYNAYNTTSKEI